MDWGKHPALNWRCANFCAMVAATRAFAVMETTMFDDLTERGVPMRVLARNYNRVLVARL